MLGAYTRKDDNTQYIGKRRSEYLEAYLEPCQTSKMECFAKTVKSF